MVLLLLGEGRKTRGGELLASRWDVGFRLMLTVCSKLCFSFFFFVHIRPSIPFSGRWEICQGRGKTVGCRPIHTHGDFIQRRTGLGKIFVCLCGQFFFILRIKKLLLKIQGV